MLRIMTFLDDKTGTELTLPVTPPDYQWLDQNRIESIEMDSMGQLNLFAGEKRGETTLTDLLFPAQLYPFCNPGAVANPWVYLDQLKRWRNAGTVVRWIVSGTPINVAVLIEAVRYREQDGTNDCYVNISLKEYKAPKTAVLAAAGAQKTVSLSARSSGTGASTAKTYTVKKGDCLWSIARKFYGNGSLYTRLAAANPSIKNTNLIYPGQVLTIPAVDNLPAAKTSVPKSVKIASATQTTLDRANKKYQFLMKRTMDL